MGQLIRNKIVVRIQRPAEPQLCLKLLYRLPADETCGRNKFICANGNCITVRYRCDQDDDCGDGSDEINCPPSHCLAQGDIKCDNGDCIPGKWRCDGEPDCSDGSDENVS